MFLEKELSDLENKFLEICLHAVQGNNLDVYALEYLENSKTVKLFIINNETDTATISECVSVDRALSEPFEELEWIPEDVVLEVSSPGVYRYLYKKEHFEKSIEVLVKVELLKKINSEMQYENVPNKLVNQKRFLGTIKGCSDELLEVEFEECSLRIPFKDIKKVNLEN